MSDSVAFSNCVATILEPCVAVKPRLSGFEPREQTEGGTAVHLQPVFIVSVQGLDDLKSAGQQPQDVPQLHIMYCSVSVPLGCNNLAFSQSATLCRLGRLLAVTFFLRQSVYFLLVCFVGLFCNPIGPSLAERMQIFLPSGGNNQVLKSLWSNPKPF